MRLAAVIAVVAPVAILGVALAVTITRGPGFHVYADQRTWLGIPHAGDVLSNLPFLIVAAWAARRLAHPLARRTCAGVATIGIGSALYHVAPSDALLALDWAPIALTLAWLAAAVLEDRIGAGAVATLVGTLFALGAVAWWLLSGGTHGGNMAPYVAVQIAGLALPAIVAVVAPGRVQARWLLLGVAGFLAARGLARYDRECLDALGVSGHSLKHVAAAVAAACGLRALVDWPR